MMLGSCTVRGRAIAGAYVMFVTVTGAMTVDSVVPATEPSTIAGLPEVKGPSVTGAEATGCVGGTAADVSPLSGGAVTMTGAATKLPMVVAG